MMMTDVEIFLKLCFSSYQNLQKGLLTLDTFNYQLLPQTSSLLAIPKT